MKGLLVIILVTTVSAQAQVNTEVKKHSKSFFAFLSFKRSTGIVNYAPTSPTFTNLPVNNSLQTTSGYWMGSSYSSYSDDGRFQSSHSFDVLGNLRESKASFSLKRKGNLSHWRVQISPQRNRPWVSYTIQ